MHLISLFHETYFAHLFSYSTPIRRKDAYKLFKILRYFTWRAFGFWNVVAVLTDSLLVWAFVLRVIGLAQPAWNHDKQEAYKLHSFQVLSCVAPLIWMSEWLYLKLG